METTTELLKRKLLLMKEILEQLHNWDGTAEDAIQVLAGNEPCFIRMKEIDQELPSAEKENFREQTQKQWNEILEKQKELLSFTQEEKIKLQNQLKQVGKKKQVVSSYIAMKESSFFVDRDV